MRISAVTLAVENMARSCDFYSRIPGFALAYGGNPGSQFTTFQIGREGHAMYLNLEKRAGSPGSARDFGRIIFHVEDVDDLYSYMKNDSVISPLAALENEPRDAPWGERFFHVRDPDGYQLSFAKPL
jgi:catechol 2,3-dioxygenase-like lactoylglutathione lyase family enzyme